MGPAIATQIILNSSLKDEFNLVHFDTRINKDVSTMGRWSFGKVIKTIKHYRRFKQLVKDTKPAIILVPISQTTMGFYKDARFIKIGAKYAKVIVQLRGSNFKNWLADASSSTNAFVRKTLAICAGVIVLGNNLKHLFEDYFPQEKIFVVPNGADYELQVSKSKELTVLYLANFLPSKSFDDVLRAIAILKERGVSNFKFTAAGAWDNHEFKQKCESIIQENDLQNVTLLAPQSGRAKMQLYADADVFVFCPKMPEGHPWVMVEAMANALPIVATDQGAIVESVMDGENGFIVPAEQPEAIADKLALLLSDQALRQQFSEKSKAHYQTNFTEQNMVENLDGVFRKVFESK